MIPLESLWLLLLIAAIGAACFYAGWRASASERVAGDSILDAAKTVSAIAEASAANAQLVKGSLDKMAAENASLRSAVNDNTKVVAEKFDGIDMLLRGMIDGMAQAGVVRRGKLGPGLQVGEKPEEE